MKQYMKPVLTITKIQAATTILTVSGGVATGATLGDSYNTEDVTYSRRGSSVWDEDE